MSDIYVGESEIAGRGVFAQRAFEPGATIEECPVLRVPVAQLDDLDRTSVFEYYFSWDKDGAIALGYGSLYNHSHDANAHCLKDIANDVLMIRAARTIDVGEEITINYSETHR